MFKGEVKQLTPYHRNISNPTLDKQKITNAATLLLQAKNPGIYVGWGAAEATKYTEKIAELLGAPVATTLQGKASFPASHPLHTGFGFGPNAVPASQKAFKNCDAMLAVGVRFSEIATGSFGVSVPENLIHIDINPKVFDKNYTTKIKLEADATEALKLLAEIIESISKKLTNERVNKFSKDHLALTKLIREEKTKYFDSWKQKPSEDKVSPGYFFEALKKFTDDETRFIVDDGKHTYLAAELLPVNRS